MKAEFRTTAGEIARMCGGALERGEPATAVVTVTSDSRDLGEKSFFVPIAGEKFDGHDFIGPLASGGSIVGCLCDRSRIDRVPASANLSVVSCDDTLRALGLLGAARRRAVNPCVVGITGTNGKTTTKDLVSAVLSEKYRCLKSEKNYNNEIGVPFTLLGLADGHDMAVIEMGMNHRGEIDRLSAIARPDMAVITSVGEGHLEFLGSVEGVAMAKAEIMNGMKPGSVIVLNRDTECFPLLARLAAERELVVKTFGLSPQCDLRPDSCRLAVDRSTVTVGGVEVSAPLYGLHNVYNILAALLAGRELGLPMDVMARALGSFRGVSMRSEIIDKGFVLINDTYNSNPLSTRFSLESARQVFPGRRKIAVLSDMLELGDAEEGCHLEAGREVVRCGFDMLFTWGERARLIHRGAVEAGMNGGSAAHFEDRSAMAHRVRELTGDGDVILVKGSRSMKMEEVVDILVR